MGLYRKWLRKANIGLILTLSAVLLLRCSGISIPNRHPGYEYAVFYKDEPITEWHVDKRAIADMYAILALDSNSEEYWIGCKEISNE